MRGPCNDDYQGDYITLLSMVRDKERLFLRHDVDHDILQAIEMAMVEADHGIKSTYFLLPTAPYFDYSALFQYNIETLLLLGHAIGLHNNALTEHLQYSKPLTKAIREPLNFLRIHYDVKLTAGHGDKFLKRRNLLNFQMWKEAAEPWSGPTLSLKDYDLEEVYFADKAYYLSDTGGRWYGGEGKVAFEGAYERCNPIKIIQDHNRKSSGTLQMLIHPYWWRTVLVKTPPPSVPTVPQ